MRQCGRRPASATSTRARAAAKKLDDERRAAEAALVARRADVAKGQAEVDRLAAAKTAAAAEVARLAAEADKLKAERAAEERRLAAASGKRAEVEAAAKAAAAAEVARLTAEADKLKAARAAEEAQLAAAQGRRAEAEAAAAKATAGAKAARAEAEAATARATAAKAAATPAPAAKAAVPTPEMIAISDIGFRGDDTVGDISITAAATVAAQVIASSDTRVEFVMDGVDLPASLERKLDVSRFGSPVRAVSTFRDRDQAGRIRIVVDLAAPATPKLSRDGNTVRIGFAGRRPVQDLPAPVMGGYGATATSLPQTSVAQVAPGRRKVFRGRIINLDFKDAPIHDLLRFIAQWAGVNIVVPDDVNASVTVKLRGVPWDQALEVILASKQLWYRKEGNLYRIANRKEIDAEDEAEAERREAMKRAEEPQHDILTLNYASAEELKEKLTPMLSEKGKLEVDKRTNALIINDIAEARRKIRELAMALDTQTPQISIEARIVEARSTFQRQFGIQWGGSANASQAGGNATGLLFPNSVGLTGGADDTNLPTTGLATPTNFAVNLPSTLSGAALGMAMGSVGGNFNINLRLSAMEENGSVRIISAPKITVLNNALAKISQGVSIPISVVGASGTQTQFVPADLSLSVTPSVSQGDCSVTMDVQVSKNEPDFVNTGARGDPTLLRKEASTKMLVADGETAVLGGIYTRNSGLSYSKVPFLGDLPVLGWLFKQRAENDERTEVLVFITPKITNKANLRCQ
jgi:type IV pilus assembly protein PilQ